MPVPKPHAGESEDEFISRCMSFFEDEDSDLDQDQRVAVCYEQWRRKKRDIEPRHYHAEYEIRFEGDTPIISGYAAIFDSLSHDLGGFRETIRQGAFKPALKSDTYLFWQHRSDQVLGRKKAGTLKLKEDDRGLHIEAKPPNWAAGYIESIQRRDVTGMSFGFIAETDEWDHKKNIRTLTKIAELPEVSIVTFPAYPATDVSVALRSKKASLEGTHSRSDKARSDHTHSRLVDFKMRQAKRRIKQKGE
jgi:HK97 family phage prohead protease